MKWLSYALFALLFAACGVAGLPDLADESQGRCGDSTIATGEACDDGNDNNFDACLSTCRLATCHDGFRRTDLPPGAEGAEACDDGNTDEDDSCVGNCQLARCGDGLVRSDLSRGERGFEACDDGDDSNPQDGCHRCKTPGCGDGVVQDNEACDDGNTLNDDACTNDCVEARCGDGIRRLGTDGEACDDGNADNTDACTNQCTLAACGDGYQQAGEACDDGNLRATDACTDTCVVADCGDGIVRSDLAEDQEGGEGCDDADDDDNDACTNDCKRARCGDTIVQRHFEACDDGNEDPGDACVNCRLATCGNGQIEGDEECDDANADNEDGCTHLCLFARCGDGFQRGDLQPSEPGAEACDDGNERDDDFCLNNCAQNVCGDGVLRRDREPGQTGYEGCDDGNAIEDDGCTNACRSGCGDGRLEEGEACDDGNFNDQDECTNACTVARCGDGAHRRLDPQEPGYEACDDGNTDNTDQCTNNCREARCGDGIVRTDLQADQTGYEDCEDEDDRVPGDGCHGCRLPRCGDGIIHDDENCDDGDAADDNGCRNDCEWGVCGDNVRRADLQIGEDGYEACDDGNTLTGDGCSGDCTRIEAVSISLSGDSSCAVFGDGLARCWGNISPSNQAQLANQANVVDVTNTMSATDFVTLNSTCTLAADGTASCWGSYPQSSERQDVAEVAQLFGRPRDPGSESRLGSFNLPMRIVKEDGNPISGLISLEAEAGTTCSLNAAGEVWCWGGIIHPASGPFASRAAIDSPVDQIAMGYRKACARTRGAGLVLCWGWTRNFGDGAWRVEPLPTHVPGTIGATFLGMGHEYGCFLSAEGVGCWGYSRFRELPLLGTNNEGCRNNYGRFYPTRYRTWPEGQTPLTSVVGSRSMTIAVTEQGELRYYGLPLGGLCDGPLSGSIPLPETVVPAQVKMGWQHACVRTTIGSVYCWGANRDGQAGLGTETITEPTLIIP